MFLVRGFWTIKGKLFSTVNCQITGKNVAMNCDTLLKGEQGKEEKTTVGSTLLAESSLDAVCSLATVQQRTRISASSGHFWRSKQDPITWTECFSLF